VTVASRLAIAVVAVAGAPVGVSRGASSFVGASVGTGGTVGVDGGCGEGNEEAKSDEFD
jgi:hypothetical protein